MMNNIELDKSTYCTECHKKMALYLIKQSPSNKLMRSKLIEKLILTSLYQTYQNANKLADRPEKVMVYGLSRKSLFQILESHFGNQKFTSYTMDTATSSLVSKELIIEESLGTTRYYLLTSDGFAVHSFINKLNEI